MAAMAAIRVKGDTAGSLATVVSLNDDNQRFRDRHGAVATLTSNHILRHCSFAYSGDNSRQVLALKPPLIPPHNLCYSRINCPFSLEKLHTNQLQLFFLEAHSSHVPADNYVKSSIIISQ